MTRCGAAPLRLAEQISGLVPLGVIRLQDWVLRGLVQNSVDMPSRAHRAAIF